MWEGRVEFLIADNTSILVDYTIINEPDVNCAWEISDWHISRIVGGKLRPIERETNQKLIDRAHKYVMKKKYDWRIEEAIWDDFNTRGDDDRGYDDV